MKSYLPAHATIEESCSWLMEQTGEQWTLARLLECGLMPWFWLDYSPGLPDIFGDRREGYLAPILFVSDTHRLSATRDDVLVTMSRTYDGKIFKIDSPQWRIPVGELRFLRGDVMQLSADITATEEKGTAKAKDIPEEADIPQQVVNTAPGDETEEAGLTKREKQIREIERIAKELKFDPLSIPEGGKGQLMKKCKAERADLFGAGDSPFEDAWKEARKQERVKTKNHHKYVS